MAHKKAGGSVKNGRDSAGQRLGVKAGDGQLVPAGSIIVRQRGMTFLAGPGTGLGPRLHRVRDRGRQGQVRARHQGQEAHPGRGGRYRRDDRLGRPAHPEQPATTGGAMALHGRRRRREPPVKPDIHPKYYEAKVHCGSCGTEWTVGSTRPELRVDVCSNCHPFFTGTQNIIDTAGQVERFQKRLERQARS